MKRLLIIGIVAVVIVAVGVGYIALFKKSPPAAQQTTTWIEAQFLEGYRHAINIMIPSTWTFDCCGDTDSFSAHSVYPPSSVSNPDTSPTITIFDFLLLGCPDGQYAGCGIDERRKVAAEQYRNTLIEHLDQNGDVAGISQIKKAGSVRLSNFVADVPVYKGVSSSNQTVELYIIQSLKGVIGVAFQQPENFDPGLKTEFLNRLTSNN